MIKRIFIFLILFFAISSIFSQKKLISGKIIDFATNKGIQNVHIYSLRLNEGTITNADGNLDPSKIDKIELITGGVVISSNTGEITFDGDIIKIQPSNNNLDLLTVRAFSQFVITKNGDSSQIASGYLYIS